MTAKKSNEKGNNIQKLRIKKKWTQEQVARSMGVKRASVCRWETGVMLPRASKLPKLAQLLNCSIDELLEEKK